MSDFFKFEDEGVDFPFYNGIPQLAKKDWAILALGPILMAMITFGLFLYIPYIGKLLGKCMPILYFLVTFLPVAYVCRGKLGLIFKKPKLKDFKVIIICYFLYYIVSAILSGLVSFLGFAPAQDAAVKNTTPILMEIILTLIQLLGEELFKVSVLLLAMGLFYYFTKNRKNTLVLGTIVCMILFGFIHLSAYEYNVVQCMLVIGLGSIVHLYPYIKTKNVVNSYILHVLIDISFMLLTHFVG